MSEGTHQFGNISLGSRSGTVCLLAVARQDSPFDRLTFNLILNTAESRSVENNYSRLLLEEDWRRSRQNCRATHQRFALGLHTLNPFSLEQPSYFMHAILSISVWCRHRKVYMDQGRTRMSTGSEGQQWRYNQLYRLSRPGTGVKVQFMASYAS